MSKQAQNVIRVYFKDVIEYIAGVPKSMIVMRYQFLNECGQTTTIRSTKVSEVYKDWYGECNLCPNNDTIIKNVYILLPNHTALDVIDEAEFGVLMDAIENFTTGRNYKDKTSI